MIPSTKPRQCDRTDLHTEHEFYDGGFYRRQCPGLVADRAPADDAYARGVTEGRRQAAEAIKGYAEEGAVVDLGDGYSEITPRLGAWTWLEVLGVRVMVDRHEGRTVLRWKRLAPPPDDLDRLIVEQLGDPQFAAAWLRTQARDLEWAREVGIVEGRRQAAAAIREADTSSWPGGRSGDVDGCQEAAARVAEGVSDVG